MEKGMSRLRERSESPREAGCAGAQQANRPTNRKKLETAGWTARGATRGGGIGAGRRPTKRESPATAGRRGSAKGAGCLVIPGIRKTGDPRLDKDSARILVQHRFGKRRRGAARSRTEVCIPPQGD